MTNKPDGAAHAERAVQLGKHNKPPHTCKSARFEKCKARVNKLVYRSCHAHSLLAKALASALARQPAEGREFALEGSLSAESLPADSSSLQGPASPQMDGVPCGMFPRFRVWLCGKTSTSAAHVFRSPSHLCGKHASGAVDWGAEFGHCFQQVPFSTCWSAGRAIYGGCPL